MKKLKTLFLGFILVLSLVLTACGGNKEGKKEEPKKEEMKKEEPKKEEPKKEEPKKEEPKKEEMKDAKVSLDMWKGNWNNIASFLEEKSVKDAFLGLEDGQAKMEKFQKSNAFEFNGMEFEGNKIKFYDKTKAKGGKVISEAEYEYVKAHPAKHGKHEFNWYEFKAKNADAKYPVILLLEAHGEEVMLHYHFKVGKNAEELLKDKEILTGTFVGESVKVEQIENVVKTRFNKKEKH